MSSGHDSWSMYLGTFGSLVLRLHVTFPLAWLLILLLAATEPSIPATAALFGGVVLTASAALREAIRVTSTVRVGGEPSVVVLAPLGNLSRFQLASDPPAHLVTSVFGCVPHLLLMVVAACWLALYGDRHALRLLQSPLSPSIDFLAGTPVLIAQLTMWINWCLLLLNLIPVPPCDGAAILRAVLWPMLGRSAAGMAATHFAHGMALVAALMALALRNTPPPGSGIPYWFPLALLSVVLLFSNNSWGRPRRYDTGLAIDEFDSDDEAWSSREWSDTADTPVLVEHIQEKQEEALNRKRREREASEDEQVDAILARLAETSFDSLPEEDRAVLKKASRRYRARRDESRDND